MVLALGTAAFATTALERTGLFDGDLFLAERARGISLATGLALGFAGDLVLESAFFVALARFGAFFARGDVLARDFLASEVATLWAAPLVLPALARTLDATEAAGFAGGGVGSATCAPLDGLFPGETVASRTLLAPHFHGGAGAGVPAAHGLLHGLEPGVLHVLHVGAPFEDDRAGVQKVFAHQASSVFHYGSLLGKHLLDCRLFDAGHPALLFGHGLLLDIPHHGTPPGRDVTLVARLLLPVGGFRELLASLFGGFVRLVMGLLGELAYTVEGTLLASFAFALALATSDAAFDALGGARGEVHELHERVVDHILQGGSLMCRGGSGEVLVNRFFEKGSETIFSCLRNGINQALLLGV